MYIDTLYNLLFSLFLLILLALVVFEPLSLSHGHFKGDSESFFFFNTQLAPLDCFLGSFDGPKIDLQWQFRGTLYLLIHNVPSCLHIFTRWPFRRFSSSQLSWCSSCRAFSLSQNIDEYVVNKHSEYQYFSADVHLLNLVLNKNHYVWK